MPPKSPDPLQKVTLNLNRADVEVLERFYGRGWTEHVRIETKNLADSIRRMIRDEEDE